MQTVPAAVAVAVTSPNPLPMESTAMSLDRASARLVVVVVEVVALAGMAVTTADATREEAVARQMVDPARHKRSWTRRWRTTGVDRPPQLKLLRSNPTPLPRNRRQPRLRQLRLLQPLRLLLQMMIST